MQIIKQNSPGTVVGLDGTRCFGQAVECDRWWRGSKPLLFVAWEPPLMCLAWKIPITNGHEVNKKGAFLKIAFTPVLKFELWRRFKSLLTSAKGLSIYFCVVSSPSQMSARS